MSGASGTRRGAVWAGLALAVVLFLGAGFYFFRARPASAELVGGAIANPPRPAPAIALTDQFGQARSLASLRGKPVALTFVYTHCVDVCPVISANMHLAYQKLGAQAQEVGMLAVTVDPERDDVSTVRSYSDKLGLTNEWYFLTGSRPQLEAIWAAYDIPAKQAGGQNGTPEQIEHAAPVFLIDKRGQLRAMLPVDVTGDTIAQDLSALLGEG